MIQSVGYDIQQNRSSHHANVTKACSSAWCSAVLHCLLTVQEVDGLLLLFGV